MSKSFQSALVLLLVLTMCLGGYFVWQNYSSSDPLDINNWKTYEDNEFSIKYPTTWFLETQQVSGQKYLILESSNVSSTVVPGESYPRMPEHYESLSIVVKPCQEIIDDYCSDKIIQDTASLSECLEVAEMVEEMIAVDYSFIGTETIGDIFFVKTKAFPVDAPTQFGYYAFSVSSESIVEIVSNKELTSGSVSRSILETLSI